MAYRYDAMGNKLRRTVTTSSPSLTTTTDYINGIQYLNGTIAFIQTQEGIARNLSGSYNYEYNLTDHLGNVRYSFDINAGAVRKLQQDNYYAFGLQKVVTSGQNKYLYNSKELQEELGQYDYGARFYDPVVGRWNVLDPLSEIYESHSPYSYGFNNPIRFVDPDGMQVEDKIDPPDKKAIQLKEVVIKPKPSYSQMAGTILMATGARTSVMWRITAANPEPYSKIVLGVATVIYTGYVVFNEIDKYNKAHSVKAEKTVDDLKKESTIEPKNNQKENEFYSKKGGIRQAEKDFADLGSSNVETKPNGTKVGRLPDGSTINVREKSTDGRPTIEVIHPNKTKTKFRYDK